MKLFLSAFLFTLALGAPPRPTLAASEKIQDHSGPDITVLRAFIVTEPFYKLVDLKKCQKLQESPMAYGGTLLEVVLDCSEQLEAQLKGRTLKGAGILRAQKIRGGNIFFSQRQQEPAFVVIETLSRLEALKNSSRVGIYTDLGDTTSLFLSNELQPSQEWIRLKSDELGVTHRFIGRASPLGNSSSAGPMLEAKFKPFMDFTKASNDTTLVDRIWDLAPVPGSRENHLLANFRYDLTRGDFVSAPSNMSFDRCKELIAHVGEHR